jgi:DNA repair protein RecO (recombination protein O)
VPLYQSDAFVLRTYKLGEADQIVVFFTRDYGKLRTVARRSYSSRRYTASFYQPLTLLHTILFGRPSQPLYRINSVDIVQTFRPLHEDFLYLRCGLYLTELIDVATQEHEPAPELFMLLHATLEQLPQAPDTSMLLRLFELRLLMVVGYTPQLLYCARCTNDVQPDEGTFSPHLGGLVCTSCATEVRQTLAVSPATLEFLRQAIAGDSSHWPSMSLDPVVQQELERVLHTHLTWRLGRELKSYPFLSL